MIPMKCLPCFPGKIKKYLLLSATVLYGTLSVLFFDSCTVTALPKFLFCK